MTNRVQLNDLYPLLRETLEGGGVFTLTVTGSSMLPLLADGGIGDPVPGAGAA